MRRDLLVALGVLVPVAILLLLSVFQSPAPHPDPLPTGRGGQRVRSAVAPPPAPPPTQDAAVEAAPAEPTSLPQALVANARQCLSDQKQQASVEVHFTPTLEGRYVDVRVTTQDPYLAACLEDVFDEARWDVSPGATESFAPTRHTFTAR